MVHVLDSCDLHPAQCLGCLFGQKEGIFLGGKNVFLVEIFLFFLFFRKFAKFSMPKHGKRNHDLDVECKVTRCISAILDIYFSFISIKFGKKTFFSYFNFYFYIYSCMVNQSSTITTLGRKDGQALVLSYIGYLTDNND
jgi:hypothetical protein